MGQIVSHPLQALPEAQQLGRSRYGRCWRGPYRRHGGSVHGRRSAWWRGYGRAGDVVKRRRERGGGAGGGGGGDRRARGGAAGETAVRGRERGVGGGGGGRRPPGAAEAGLAAPIGASLTPSRGL